MRGIEKRLADLERTAADWQSDRAAAQERAKRAALSQMTSEELRTLIALWENQRAQPGYLPTAAEQAALERWHELYRGQDARD